jgi:hypothetical protein
MQSSDSEYSVNCGDSETVGGKVSRVSRSETPVDQATVNTARMSPRRAEPISPYNTKYHSNAKQQIRSWLSKNPRPGKTGYNVKSNYSFVYYGCDGRGCNPGDPLPRIAGALRGGWGLRKHHPTENPEDWVWSFIAGDASKKKLDDSVGFHKGGEIVYGLEWMGQARMSYTLCVLSALLWFFFCGNGRGGQG